MEIEKTNNPLAVIGTLLTKWPITPFKIILYGSISNPKHFYSLTLLRDIPKPLKGLKYAFIFIQHTIRHFHLRMLL